MRISVRMDSISTLGYTARIKTDCSYSQNAAILNDDFSSLCDTDYIQLFTGILHNPCHVLQALLLHQQITTIIKETDT